MHVSLFIPQGSTTILVLLEGGGHAGEDAVGGLCLGHIENGLLLSLFLRLRCKEVLVARGLLEEIVQSIKPVGIKRFVLLQGQVKIGIILGFFGQLAIYDWRCYRLSNVLVDVAGSFK